MVKSVAVCGGKYRLVGYHNGRSVFYVIFDDEPTHRSSQRLAHRAPDAVILQAVCMLQYVCLQAESAPVVPYVKKVYGEV